jgi:uncharacterized protein YjbJ (UPF0337 family)
MTWDQIAGNWKQFEGKVKEKWGKLTHDDLAGIAGKHDPFAEMLLKYYGYQKTRAQKEIDEFARSVNP